MSEPYKCPVCYGVGQVAEGFYDRTSPYWTTSNNTFEQCKSCNGTGVVWSPFVIGPGVNLTEEVE